MIDNRLAANRLAANRLAANRLAANRLAANRLAANRLELNVGDAGELLGTPEGREVLSFIVSCAVKEGETLVADFEGNHYEFFGELGLANKWLTHRLDDKGKGWVSACLFSRVNASNVPIPISLRGTHQQLTVDPEEADAWTLEEGAFYGDYFTPPNQPIDWNACRGRAQAAGESGGLLERDCAEPDPAHPGLTLCGFKYAGDCGDFATHHACKRFNEDGTYYTKCAATPKFGANHHHGHDDDDHHDGDGCWGNNHGNGNDTYAQVITVYVIP
ncbi:MAG: hypothetical protein ABI867_11405 [Kofleriaceae bacterium]